MERKRAIDGMNGERDDADIRKELTPDVILLEKHLGGDGLYLRITRVVVVAHQRLTVHDVVGVEAVARDEEQSVSQSAPLGNRSGAPMQRRNSI